MAHVCFYVCCRDCVGSLGRFVTRGSVGARICEV